MDLQSDLSLSFKQEEIEAVYYQANSRAEFRLHPNKLYSTDLILSNIGMTRLANQGQVHKFVGVYGLIENLTIYDGNTVLSNLSDAGFWSGFKMLTNSNQYAKTVSHYLSGNRQSTTMNRTDQLNLNTTTDIAGFKLVQDVAKDLRTSAVDGTTFKGQLRLRMIYDLLVQMRYIDTSIFKDFRIVVEFNSQIARSVYNSVNVQNNTTTRPFLVVQEVISEAILESEMGKMGNVVYNEIENDLVNIPAIPVVGVPVGNVVGLANANRYREQVNTFHLNSFNNKSIGRLLLWKQPTIANNLVGDANRPVANGIYNSTEFLNEVEQVRCNGRNVLPRNGVAGSNRRLAHFVDSWGSPAICPFMNGLADRQITATTRQTQMREGNEVYGATSFVGLEINQKCNDLQIDVSRRGIFMATVANGAGAGAGTGLGNDIARTTGSKYNSSHNLQVWGEVKKAVVVSGGSYNVVYV